MSALTHPTRGAQRYFRGEYGMVADGPEYPSRNGDVFWIAESDYAALQARIAELSEQVKAAEARNAASEREGQTKEKKDA